MAQTQHPIKHAIEPREKLDFQLDETVPRFWCGGDPYKTRFFDAMSLTFPVGERFFISSVRAYRDQITDPELLQEVKDFTRQEGQHGVVHTKWNALLENQGLPCVPRFERFVARKFDFHLKYLPKSYNLAYTSAAEHLTAMMGSAFVDRADMAPLFDPRMRAVWSWHSIEEIEHKAVAYDVMTKVAKVSYAMRIFALVTFTLEFSLGNWFGVNRMLKEDGFGVFQRTKMLIKGAWWLYKPGGLFMPSLGYYVSYLKPGFHPWQHKGMREYDTWVKAFKRSHNPIEASEAYYQKVMARQA